MAPSSYSARPAIFNSIAAACHRAVVVIHFICNLSIRYFLLLNSELGMTKGCLWMEEDDGQTPSIFMVPWLLLMNYGDWRWAIQRDRTGWTGWPVCLDCSYLTESWVEYSMRPQRYSENMTTIHRRSWANKLGNWWRKVWSIFQFHRIMSVALQSTLNRLSVHWLNDMTWQWLKRSCKNLVLYCKSKRVVVTLEYARTRH